MATVYLAHDVRHDRKVAIKVLKPELAAVLGAERFVVEIKTTAALSHPHILPLFDSGTADGFLYYVMPYIKGETIREKLNRETQFGVDEAVRIAREVADALDYAHRHGVIHRDIKPENILLHDGRPMVMDFGIALAVSAAAGGRMTETGLSLGTPHYMSPEQATADKEITGRSDVYSLASVLYEMLAGQPPHVGGSAQQVIMKIIAEPAQPVTALRKSVPPNVSATLARALEKLPADRFDNAKSFGDALLNPTFAFDRRLNDVAVLQANWRHRIAVPALVVAGVAALTAVWFSPRRAPDPPVRRYAVEFSDPPRVLGQGSSIAVSPDGRRIAYLGRRDGVQRVYLRALDQLVSTEVPGSEGAINPFFSPDGNSIGFMISVRSIRTASVSGSPAVTVVDSAVGSPGATWSPDGYIYYDQLGIGPLLRVRAQGGRPEKASELDSTRAEAQHCWPDALPNGRGIIIVVNQGGPGRQGLESDEIAVLDTRTKKHRVLMNGVFARYAASGHLLYVTAAGALMAVPFDQDRMEVTGEPMMLAEGIARMTGAGGVDLTISRDGMLWYGTGERAGLRRELSWVTREGRFSPVDTGLSDVIDAIALSPDGKRAALAIQSRDSREVWVRELVSGGTMDKLTFGGSSNFPFWSVDGQFIDFTMLGQAGPGELRRVAANGSGVAAPLFRDPRPIRSGTWSPGGNWLVFETVTQDLYVVRPGVDSAAIPLIATPAVEGRPAISPDGNWLLYTSNRSGRSEVYAVPFPNATSALKQVSSDEGVSARWSRDGSEIFYRNRTGEMIAVAVTSREPLTLGTRRVLFRLGDAVQSWDVAPDGRFLLVRVSSAGASDSASTQVFVVENLFQELRGKGSR